MDVRVGLWRKLRAEELMLLNCGAGADSWEFLGLQGDPSVYPKRDQSQVFIGRTDAEAETLILWPPHGKSWLIGKDRDAGREEKGLTEDEMVGWHHRLNEHEFEWTLWVGDGLGVLLQSVGSQGVRHDWATNWTELNWPVHETLKCLLQHHNLKASNLWCSAFISGGQSIGVSASTSVLPMNIQD